MVYMTTDGHLRAVWRRHGGGPPVWSPALGPPDPRFRTARLTRQAGWMEDAREAVAVDPDEAVDGDEPRTRINRNPARPPIEAPTYAEEDNGILFHS